MLDKLITYIVCWFKPLYRIFPVVSASRIATRSDTILQTRLHLIYSLVSTHCM